MVTIDVKKFDFPVDRLDGVGVIGLYLFGSQAQGLGSSLSDIDVGYFMRSDNVKIKKYDNEAGYAATLVEHVRRIVVSLTR